MYGATSGTYKIGAQPSGSSKFPKGLGLWREGFRFRRRRPGVQISILWARFLAFCTCLIPRSTGIFRTSECHSRRAGLGAGARHPWKPDVPGLSRDRLFQELSPTLTLEPATVWVFGDCRCRISVAGRSRTAVRNRQPAWTSIIFEYL